MNDELLNAVIALLKSEWKLSVNGTLYHCIGTKELDEVRAAANKLRGGRTPER